MSNTIETPRVWIGCLAAYNNGQLHGEWIDADHWLEFTVNKILDSSPIDGAEEWHVCDYEGFYGLDIDRYESIASIIDKAEAIETAAERGADPAAVAVFIEHYTSGSEGFDAERFSDLYCGPLGESEESFIRDRLYEGDFFDGWTDDAENYFDMAAYARDQFINYYNVYDGHVFLSA